MVPGQRLFLHARAHARTELRASPAARRSEQDMTACEARVSLARQHAGGSRRWLDHEMARANECHAHDSAGRPSPPSPLRQPSPPRAARALAECWHTVSSAWLPARIGAPLLPGRLPRCCALRRHSSRDGLRPSLRDFSPFSPSPHPYESPLAGDARTRSCAFDGHDNRSLFCGKSTRPS